MIQPWQWLRNTKTSTHLVTLSVAFTLSVAGCRSAQEVIQHSNDGSESYSFVSAPLPDSNSNDTGTPEQEVTVAPAPPVPGSFDEPTYDEKSKSPQSVNPNDEPIEPLIAESNDKLKTQSKLDIRSTIEKNDVATADPDTLVLDSDVVGKFDINEQLNAKSDNSDASEALGKLQSNTTETPSKDTSRSTDAVTPLELPMPKIRKPGTKVKPRNGSSTIPKLPGTTDASTDPIDINSVEPKTTEAAPLSLFTPFESIETVEDRSPKKDTSKPSPLFPISPKTDGVETTSLTETQDINAAVIDNSDSDSPVLSVPRINLPEIEPLLPLTDAVLDEPTDQDRVVARAEISITDDIPVDAIQKIVIPELVATIDGEVSRIAIASGKTFVSHNNGIIVVDSEGKISNFSSTGSPKGLIVSDKTVIACDAEHRAVIRLNESGEFAGSIGVKSDGYFLRSPNSIVADATGGFYFSDPGYARIRNAIGKVHYINAQGKVSLAIRKLAYPEGVAISTDGTQLLVAEGQRNQIAAFQILSPGKLGPKEVFCKLPRKNDSDRDEFATGLCIDRIGNVYVAHHGMQQVEVISPKGEWLRSIELPGTTVADVAIANSDDKATLIVIGQSQNQDRGQVWRLPIE
jgi:gluconolactonase